jgi:Helix-turn-helix
MAGELSQAIGPKGSMPLRALEPALISVPDYECTLKAVALKPSIGSICVREADAQRPPTRHLGEEHAPAPSCAGLSQEALAHNSGMNRTYLSAVQQAERNVSIDSIGRIAKGLHVEPWRLLKDAR